MMTRILVVHAILFALALLSVVAAPAAGTEFTPILPLKPPTIVGHSETYPGEAWDVSGLLDGELKTEQAMIRWAAPVPKSVWLSDLSEQPLREITGTVDVPAWGVVTLRANLRE